MPFTPKFARRIARALGGDEVTERSDRLLYKDVGHGFDPFGLNSDFVALGEAITKLPYEKYFRVLSYGHENIPKTGPGVLASM